jgi:hypothetical protein
VASARLLAKELVRTRKATTQLYTNKAHMIAMGTQLQEQLAMVKVPMLLLVCCKHWRDWADAGSTGRLGILQLACCCTHVPPLTGPCVWLVCRWRAPCPRAPKS